MTSRKLKEMLEAERLFSTPTAADRRRNRLALAKQLSLGASVGASALSTSSWGAWLASAPAKWLATVALAAAGSGSLAWVASSMSTGSERAVAQPSAAPSTPAERPQAAQRDGANPAPTTSPSPTPAAELDLPSPKPRTADKPQGSASATGPSPAADTPPVDNLAAQTRLLSETRAAMRAGNPAQALAVLEDNAPLLAAGPLSEEVAATRVFALCQLGRTSEARRSASSFVSRFPGSALGTKVRGACSGER